MRSLPLFHRISGQPVIVLGDGGAEPKRRLVERAGGIVIRNIDEGIKAGAQLAFIALEDERALETAVSRLRGLGTLINVVDRPDLCDFTTPSLLERDPVLIAIGTSGASAGLAKHIRLRLEALLPQTLGALAQALHSAHARLRARWPGAGERRQALDVALGAGGALDPLNEGSAEAVDMWLEGASQSAISGRVTIALASDDPEELTLRQARLLGTADALLFEKGVPEVILNRARADALRRELPFTGDLPDGVIVELQYADPAER